MFALSVLVVDVAGAEPVAMQPRRWSATAGGSSACRVPLTTSEPWRDWGKGTAILPGSRRPGGLAYAAAKAGVQGFTASLARELAPRGITVNTITSGLIAGTGFFGAAGIPPERMAEIVSEIPVGRAGCPDDVAATTAWLASGEAAFVTGATIPVNGGWRIN